MDLKRQTTESNSIHMGDLSTQREIDELAQFLNTFDALPNNSSDNPNQQKQKIQQQQQQQHRVKLHDSTTSSPNSSSSSFSSYIPGAYANNQSNNTLSSHPFQSTGHLDHTDDVMESSFTMNKDQSSPDSHDLLVRVDSSQGIQLMNKKLLMMGLPADLVLPGKGINTESALHTALSCISRLIHMQTRTDAETQDCYHKLMVTSDSLARAEKTIFSLEQSLFTQKNLAGSLQAKALSLEDQLKSQKHSQASITNDLRAQIQNLIQRETQFKFELRKREKEYSRLQDKLRDAIMARGSRKLNTRSSILVTQALPRVYTPFSSSADAAQDFNDLAFQADRSHRNFLLNENSQLRDSLTYVQDQLAYLIDSNYDLMAASPSKLNTHPKQESSQDIDFISDTVNSHTPNKVSTPSRSHLELPYSVIESDVQIALDRKFAILKDRMRQAANSAPASSKNSNQIKMLQDQLAQCKKIIAQQNELINVAFESNEKENDSSSINSHENETTPCKRHDISIDSNVPKNQNLTPELLANITSHASHDDGFDDESDKSCLDGKSSSFRLDAGEGDAQICFSSPQAVDQIYTDLSAVNADSVQNDSVNEKKGSRIDYPSCHSPPKMITDSNVYFELSKNNDSSACKATTVFDFYETDVLTHSMDAQRNDNNEESKRSSQIPYQNDSVLSRKAVSKIHGIDNEPQASPDNTNNDAFMEPSSFTRLLDQPRSLKTDAAILTDIEVDNVQDIADSNRQDCNHKDEDKFSASEVETCDKEEAKSKESFGVQIMDDIAKAIPLKGVRSSHASHSFQHASPILKINEATSPEEGSLEVQRHNEKSVKGVVETRNNCHFSSLLGRFSSKSTPEADFAQNTAEDHENLSNLLENQKEKAQNERETCPLYNSRADKQVENAISSVPTTEKENTNSSWIKNNKALKKEESLSMGIDDSILFDMESEKRENIDGDGRKHRDDIDTSIVLGKLENRPSSVGASGEPSLSAALDDSILFSSQKSKREVVDTDADQSLSNFCNESGVLNASILFSSQKSKREVNDTDADQSLSNFRDKSGVLNASISSPQTHAIKYNEKLSTFSSLTENREAYAKNENSLILNDSISYQREDVEKSIVFSTEEPETTLSGMSLLFKERLTHKEMHPVMDTDVSLFFEVDSLKGQKTVEIFKDQEESSLCAGFDDSRLLSIRKSDKIIADVAGCSHGKPGAFDIVPDIRDEENITSSSSTKNANVVNRSNLVRAEEREIQNKQCKSRSRDDLNSNGPEADSQKASPCFKNKPHNNRSSPLMNIDDSLLFDLDKSRNHRKIASQRHPTSNTVDANEPDFLKGKEKEESLFADFDDSYLYSLQKSNTKADGRNTEQLHSECDKDASCYDRTFPTKKSRDTRAKPVYTYTETEITHKRDTMVIEDSDIFENDLDISMIPKSSGNEGNKKADEDCLGDEYFLNDTLELSDSYNEQQDSFRRDSFNRENELKKYF